MDLKHAAISISMIVFVLSSMLGMGLGLRVSEIVAPLRNLRHRSEVTGVEGYRGGIQPSRRILRRSAAKRGSDRIGSKNQ